MTKWKPSYFNIIFNRNGRRQIFNSSSSQMLELSKTHADIFEAGLAEVEELGYCESKEMLDCLVSLGFVVPEDKQEYEIEHSRLLTSMNNKESLKLTIAPTMACNLKCSYCFQKNVSYKKKMDKEIQDGIVEFVNKKMAGCKNLVVQWFGGEPLLAYDQIMSMSESFQDICKRQGATYYSEMLTNGTLLTEKIIESFRNISLKAIQISFDGDTGTYAMRKNISVKQAEKYHHFLVGHMQSIVDITGSATIRINVDRNNIEAGYDVVRMFKRHGCTDNRLDFRLGFINLNKGILDCISHDCFSGNEFLALEMDFRYFLEKEGYKVYGRPTKQNFPCSAPLEYSYTIDPEGKIGKCVPAMETKDENFSRIYPDNIARTIAETNIRDKQPYNNFDPFISKYCEGCKLLPACLGNCPRMFAPGGEFECRKKEGLSELITFYFHHPQQLESIKINAI